MGKTINKQLVQTTSVVSTDQEIDETAGPSHYTGEITMSLTASSCKHCTGGGGGDIKATELSVFGGLWVNIPP